MLKRGAGPFAGLLLILVVLTGCAGTDGGGVASAGGGEAGPSASGGPSQDPKQATMAYVECLREHGMEVDDPGPDGRLKLRVQGDQAKSREAMEACRDLAPQMDKNDPKYQQRMGAAQEHATCMRENGVEKFPDPDPNQPGIQINKELAGDPDFEAAQEACKDLLGGAVGK
ncbi:hypothetical protein [Microlunatus parietis]|uniref:Uncharacterized protein n=1 Tax=Microlunatus parietis TaxID=682979 RepID=A0A7Y9IEE2_9ACTN|nr:hypothetical protein [Microlunatus parietis]NYE75081.1 hypothetical protein [Microlunatus parietis]